ncbi:hypothetical protein GCM10010260_81300 [Streptomyces filipinensis]|uniref:Uncharacterized protein n=1 Tax=Streptomyces filipinensis TaxID=66887 RepID=A0A918ILC1_9ACTN|nr:hypothetical protein GCM10010260_81300 [Streptomyces filipinensis]
MPLVHRLPRPVAFRQIAPLHVCPDPVQHSVDYLPMVPPSATASVAHWQERLKSLPLGVSQITPMSHIPINDSIDRQGAA